MATLQITKWHDIRGKVRQQNKDLAEIIDEIDPDDSFKLYVGVYSYGEHIITRGIFNVPNAAGGMDPLNSAHVSSEVKDELGYNFFTNPVSLVLQNTLEIFYDINHVTIPFLYGLVSAGSIISSWKVISDFQSHGPPFLWSMTAGARSIFMLSKISDSAGNNRLKKEFNISFQNTPKTYSDQWSIFRSILRSPAIKNGWETKILFFGKKWFENLSDDKFKNLYLYLLRMGWRGSNYSRHQIIWDLIYSTIQEHEKIKAEPYIIDTVKHLLTLPIGVAPGFSPAIDDSAGPISLLVDIYKDVYKTKKYDPIFMHPHAFSLNENRPIYYSLSYPTTLNYSVRLNEESSKIQDLISVCSVMKKFNKEISKGSLNIENTATFELVNKYQFKYFHSEKGYYDVKSISELFSSDVNFKKLAQYDYLQFPCHSSFFKGCIQLSAK